MSLTQRRVQRLVWLGGSPRARTLEAQMAVPMFNEHPIEMGIKGNESGIVAPVRGDPADAAAVRRGLSRRRGPVSLDNIVKAIASFERTLAVRRIPRSIAISIVTSATALSAPAQRGMALFFSDRLACGALPQRLQSVGSDHSPRQRRCRADVSQHRPLQRRRPRRVSGHRSRSARHHAMRRPTWAASARRRFATSP